MRVGAWLLAVLVGMGALAAIAIATAPSGEAMDPEDTGPTGGAALLAVLEQQGIAVDVVTSITDVDSALRQRDEDVTVVVPSTRNLGVDAAATLREASLGVGRVVLLAPSSDQLDAMGTDVTALPIGASIPVESRCDIGPVDRGDTLDDVTMRYEARGQAAGVRTCFPLLVQSEDGGEEGEGDHGSGLVDLPSTPQHAPVTVVGTTAGFTNRGITDEDNAALALRLFGGSPRLLWYQPGVADLASSDGGAGGSGLLPRWLLPAVGLVCAGVVVLALVRGRRLGALVREPLPVVIRAIETTEARGRLYRRAQDRPRAAAVLRQASLTRLRRRLGLRRGDPVEAVARATSAATGRPVHEVLDLVAGPPPTDDAALVRLAQDLSDLEEKAHRP